jgi:hypothetical protein
MATPSGTLSGTRIPTLIPTLMGTLIPTLMGTQAIAYLGNLPERLLPQVSHAPRGPSRAKNARDGPRYAWRRVRD